MDYSKTIFLMLLALLMKRTADQAVQQVKVVAQRVTSERTLSLAERSKRTDSDCA